MADRSASYAGARVLVTGGLGMIGSTLAHRLVPLGARVTLVDACIEPYGANLFNLEGIRERVAVNITDIRDRESMKTLVKGQDVVFNLAGQVSHNDSLENPYLDAEINYIGHLNVLECLRRNNPRAVVVHAGSRLQFGRIDRTPVDESHPLRPKTPYALHKTAAENLYLFYAEIHRQPCICFRIANPYGPRSQMRHSKYSMINWFLRQAMEDKPIKVFGDGEQIRDYIYVEDLAEALLAAAATPECRGQVYNVGSGVGSKFRDMVRTIVEGVGAGRAEHVPWPQDYVNVETGDYVTDTRKLCAATGWQPRTGLTEGVRLTIEYYRRHRAQYW
ncbi:MAG: NAD-dependent epimerase/dehydratase family protein [Planctomycetes bacterium]|nr:NAD-dependent epimerase/dehydratase family protein [Planctomycetota bacterium]